MDKTKISINIETELLKKLDIYAQKEYGGLRYRTLAIHKILEKWLETNG